MCIRDSYEANVLGDDDKREPVKIARLPPLLVLLALAWLPVVIRAQQLPAPKRVLVLYWYDKSYPGHVLWDQSFQAVLKLSLIHISEPTRLLSISYAVFCLKKKKK